MPKHCQNIHFKLGILGYKAVTRTKLKSSLGYQVFHWYLHSKAAYYWWLAMKLERSMAGHSLYIIEKMGNSIAKILSERRWPCKLRNGCRHTIHVAQGNTNTGIIRPLFIALLSLNTWKLSNLYHSIINTALSHPSPNHMKRLSLIFIKVNCHLRSLSESMQTHFDIVGAWQLWLTSALNQGVYIGNSSLQFGIYDWIQQWKLPPLWKRERRQWSRINSQASHDKPSLSMISTTHVYSGVTL